MDADPQTGMFVVLLPVPDHVRLVHSAPLDFPKLLPIRVLSALSNERNALWPGASHPVIGDQALRRNYPPHARRTITASVPHITLRTGTLR
ncbi:hypothetical protein GCM10010216_15260 [Streptomyces flaveolus]|nr:hypothetical protein GCM10010216_15260 [Streptomyces flaveolus]